jgi:hypothetical protein
VGVSAGVAVASGVGVDVGVGVSVGLLVGVGVAVSVGVAVHIVAVIVAISASVGAQLVRINAASINSRIKYFLIMPPGLPGKRIFNIVYLHLLSMIQIETYFLSNHFLSKKNLLKILETTILSRITSPAL